MTAISCRIRNKSARRALTDSGRKTSDFFYIHSRNVVNKPVWGIRQMDRWTYGLRVIISPASPSGGRRDITTDSEWEYTDTNTMYVYVCMCVCVWSASAKCPSWTAAVDRAGRAPGDRRVMASTTPAQRPTHRLPSSLRHRRRRRISGGSTTTRRREISLHDRIPRSVPSLIVPLSFYSTDLLIIVSLSLALSSESNFVTPFTPCCDWLW